LGAASAGSAAGAAAGAEAGSARAIFSAGRPGTSVIGSSSIATAPFIGRLV
jgi:hypothetical protein